jgi:hydroxymethylbilane synthase
MHLTVCARRSPLAQAQVREVQDELHVHHPHVVFDCLFIDTHGDMDKATSLRSLYKTDFFTREIDRMLLSGHCRIAIHSAKDLPEPLPKGIVMVALTRGVDASDALVMRSGQSLSDLPSGALIATSSERREEAVRNLRNDLRFTDIRGTIGERLEKLSRGEVDGVVIAEAALIRLSLTHLNRVKLPGETAQYQGQLAVMARENDSEMQTLFSALDTK